jgi:hypothetical protein
MKWFGESWGAPVCAPEDHAELPTTPCGYCEKPFVETDKGVLMPFVGNPGDPPEIGYHHPCLMIALGLDTKYVHLLRAGFAVCAFSKDVPGEWPSGHKWAHDVEHVTCPDCLQRA